MQWLWKIHRVGKGREMLDLIGMELTRVRKMAEKAGCDPLVYVIDMAILEANAHVWAHDDSPETPVGGQMGHANQNSHRERGRKLRVVR